MSNAWFKFYGRDFRDGVLGDLTFEEIGIYVVLLTLLYDGQGKIIDEDAYVCAKLHCDTRVWKRIKAKLCRFGKIVPTEDGHLINRRVIKEVTYAEDVAEKRRTSGKLGGQQSGKVRSKPLNENETGEAIASIVLQHTGAFSETQNTDTPPTLRSGGVVAHPNSPKPKRMGKRRVPLPDDWAPTPDDERIALQDLKFTSQEFSDARDEFATYWRGEGGRLTAGEPNWSHAFRGRCRDLAKRWGTTNRRTTPATGAPTFRPGGAGEQRAIRHRASLQLLHELGEMEMVAGAASAGGDGAGAGGSVGDSDGQPQTLFAEDASGGDRSAAVSFRRVG